VTSRLPPLHALAFTDTSAGAPVRFYQIEAAPAP
jgi:hypothetical protein